jgi:hypothetical protein
MIEVSGHGGAEPRIEGWPDSGGIAVITWRSHTGGTHQQELTDEQEAITLLRSIEDDPDLSLISAQLRRLGTGPAG